MCPSIPAPGFPTTKLLIDKEIFALVVIGEYILPLDGDEITKVGFLNTLFSVYCLEEKGNNPKDFIESVFQFYNIIQPENLNFIKKLLLVSFTDAYNVLKHVSNKFNLSCIGITVGVNVTTSVSSLKYLTAKHTNHTKIS